MKDCVIERAALLKILLHSIRYPSSACNGVLLGADAADGGVLITDAVPIGHNYITLTPVLETALSQVEQHMRAQQGPRLRIAGYYQCNERMGDTELGAGRRVADRIEAAFPDSVAVVLDSAALEAALMKQQQEQAGQQPGGGGSEPPLLLVYAKDGGRGWVKLPSGGKPGSQCPSQGIAAQLAQFAAEGRHRSLVDFEAHLDDIAADWLNPGLLDGPA